MKINKAGIESIYAPNKYQKLYHGDLIISKQIEPIYKLNN